MLKRLYAFLFLLGLFYPLYAQKQNIGIAGKVTESDKPIQGASISIDKKGIGTSANKEGEFILFIPAVNMQDTLRVSCIGYQTAFIPIKSFIAGQQFNITLKANSVPLNEVKVAYYDVDKIIQKAIGKIAQNYINHPHVTRGFYRMYTHTGNVPLELSEAVFDIYNFGYTDKHADMFKLIKARDKKNQQDFSSFDLGLRPNTIFNYDIVNHLFGSGFLNADGIRKHNFDVTGIVDVKGYPAYEITFKEKENISDDSFSGKFYVDTQTYAFIYFDFGLSQSAIRNGGAGVFAGGLLKSKDNINLKVKSNRCRVGYQKVGNKWVLSDVTGDDELEINSPDPKHSLVANIRFNYQVTSVDTAQTTSFTKKSGRQQNINDYNSNGDDAFWKDYNILLSNFNTEDVFKRIQAINQSIKK